MTFEASNNEAKPREESIVITQQSLYYFMVAIVFGIAGFIIGAAVFSARGGTSIEDIRNAAAEGARSAVQEQIAGLSARIDELSSNQQNGQPTQPQGPVQINTEGSPSWGPADAKVTIVEFSDFQCPFCARFHAETYELLQAEYGSRVRFVFKHYPIVSRHPEAANAANASECAREQGKFVEYYRALFANYENLNRNTYLSIAQSVGVADINSFTTCMDSSAHFARIQADLDEGNIIGVTGTPTFYVNGLPLVGAQPYAAFKIAIDQALAKP
jgi:protein-disulfide isomerase